MSRYLARHPFDETTHKRFGNLPQWAKAELDRLSGELDALEARTATDPDNSDTWAWPYAKVPTPLGRPKVIAHRYRDGQEATITWMADERPLAVPTLEILVSFGRPVLLLGGASNVATLRLERDR